MGNYQYDLPDFIHISQYKRSHIYHSHASIEARDTPFGYLTEKRPSKFGGEKTVPKVAKAVFSHNGLVNPCVIAALTTPTRWAFHKEGGIFNMPRVTVLKKFDSKIGHLGLNGECTKWVRVVADVDTAFRRFAVVTAYPAYTYPWEVSKRDTHDLSCYVPSLHTSFMAAVVKFL